METVSEPVFWITIVSVPVSPFIRTCGSSVEETTVTSAEAAPAGPVSAATMQKIEIIAM